MFNKKKDYPNCNMCIWQKNYIYTAQGFIHCKEVYATSHCFRVFKKEGKELIINAEKGKKNELGNR